MKRIFVCLALLCSLDAWPVASLQPQPRRTYLVILMGRAANADLRKFKSSIAKLNRRLRTPLWLFEEPENSTERTMLVYLDRGLVEASAEEMAAFKKEADKIEGLTIQYRPVSFVHASLSLELWTATQRLVRFSLGDIQNTFDPSAENISSPVEYIFQKQQGKGLCKQLDEACFRYLAERKFLEGHQVFQFWWTNGIEKRVATTHEILDYLFSRSSMVAEKYRVNNWDESWDDTYIIKEVKLEIGNFRFTDLNDAQTEFRMYLEERGLPPRLETPFVNDQQDRILMRLPGVPNVVVSSKGLNLKSEQLVQTFLKTLRQQALKKNPDKPPQAMSEPSEAIYDR